MTLIEAINYRRSVRNYKSLALDTEKVKHCLELATLAPNSSNMQLWEFYHITSPEILKKLAVACLNQETATTAQLQKSLDSFGKIKNFMQGKIASE